MYLFIYINIGFKNLKKIKNIKLNLIKKSLKNNKLNLFKLFDYLSSFYYLWFILIYIKEQKFDQLKRI